MGKKARKFGQPTPSDVHVNQMLSNISVAYLANNENYIATKVFPVLPVDHQTNIFRTYNKNDWLRDEMQIRPPATESAGSGYNTSQDTYSCDVWALHKDVDDQTLMNADPDLDLGRDATRFLMQKAAIRQERAWSESFFATGIWGTSFTPTATWDDVLLSTPIADMEVAKRAILSPTGYRANTIVAGYDAFIALANHPDIIERFKYTSSEVMTTDLLARIFGVKNFYVADGIYASNVEGETAVYGFVHGSKNLWIGHVADNPGLLTPSAGYTFMWKGVSRGLGLTAAVKDFYMDEIEARRYEVQIAFDDKVIAADLGYMFVNATA